ncbi:unnamed protein product [Ceutorhynchus assimilis]|uniref:Ionotropic glutamate receptor C-terminal domain-containing protein n=1 Tax=Ceutorhynchus assimilis TaxID=467358 RepID=A0A9N9MWS3_9CUCU|nr:unnamed protein product [Ceutorhynchus assimilis]
MEIGSAAQQGYESEPRSNSGRIVFILTLISLMFLYTSFSASIVALLQSTTESLNTLESLFQSRIPVGFKENITMDYFNELKHDQKKTKEFVKKISKPEFMSTEQGIKRVQKDFFAFYGDTYEIYKYVNDWFYENEKCSLREIKFKNTHVNYWLFMKKNSSYQDKLRTGMHKIHETGIQSREYRRLFATKPTCDVMGGNFESVGLSDSYGAFLGSYGWRGATECFTISSRKNLAKVLFED